MKFNFYMLHKQIMHDNLFASYKKIVCAQFMIIGKLPLHYQELQYTQISAIIEPQGVSRFRSRKTAHALCDTKESAENQSLSKVVLPNPL